MFNDFTLEDFAAKLAENNELSTDYIAETDRLGMVLTEEEENPETLIKFDQGDTEKFFAPTETAHSQIATRLGIPVKYYRKMKQEAPQLLVDSVNRWFEDQPEKRMLRTFGAADQSAGVLRALLSDRYRRIDNWDLANVVIPILQEAQVEIKSCSITETKMYIKGVLPRVQGEVKKGDVVEAGVAISNSEIGMGSVKIEPLIHRLVCLNGMIINDAKFAARHVGSQIKAEDNIAGFLTDETKAADDKALMLKVRDVTNAAFDQNIFEAHLDQMRDTADRKLEGNPAEAVKVLAKTKRLTESEEGGVLRHLIEGGDLSQWGLLNAVTRASQDVENYDRATEMEALGGEILTLPESEWMVLQEA